MSRAALRRAPFVATVVGLALIGASCSPNCGVADTVVVLDSRGADLLVYRVSGSHEKVEIFEVYRGKPKFDACGLTATSAIAKEPYLRSEGLLKKVEIHGDRLEIIYTHNASESIKPEQARLSR